MCDPTPDITSPDFVSGATSSIDPVTININLVSLSPHLSPHLGLVALSP